MFMSAAQYSVTPTKRGLPERASGFFRDVKRRSLRRPKTVTRQQASKLRASGRHTMDIGLQKRRIRAEAPNKFASFYFLCQ